MKASIIIFIVIAGQIFYSCTNDSKFKVLDVKLEEVKDTSAERLEPPPPPPPGVPADGRINSNKTAPAHMTFNKWLTEICKKENPSDAIIAYNFGIFETPQGGYTVYLIGSKEFDAEDSDWATNDDFFPDMKYFQMPQSEFRNIKFEIALAKIEGMIKEFMKTETYRKSFFAKAKAITTGFDDGDLIRLK